jgi:hypothetical protein
MEGSQLSLQLDAPPPVMPVRIPATAPERNSTPEHPAATPATMASGQMSKARDILAAIRALKAIEQESRPATPEEKQALGKFSGFGPVALSIFPDPVTGKYKDERWQAVGQELQSLLTPEEYDSAKRTTFNAFYTSPTVIAGIHDAIHRLGIHDGATILEPGCGIGNFMRWSGERKRFIGVEMDSISGRIARAIHPQHDIRIENFRDTKLPEGRIDAVVGNVPFADVKLDYQGQKYSLHDFFFAKSIDALKPGGVLALVTSHYTLDKQNAAIREYLADKADFVGAIRLPSDAFKREGTAVVTDIIFLRKRAPGEPARHVDPDWLGIAPLAIDGAEVPVNRYFLNHPEMVLGNWSRKDTLYGGEGFSVESNGDLKRKLDQALAQLPRFKAAEVAAHQPEAAPAFVPPPPERHIGEGSFFVAADKVIHQTQGGQGEPVVYGGKTLKADGTMTGRRMALLLELRDRARRVLQSQNEGWPDENRDQARRELNRTYDRFVAAYGPINKTTFGETKDGSIIRRMPNLVKFKEDPDAMLVMSLEDYDEVTGKAAKSAIMERDVVGRHAPITQVRSAEEGLLVSLNQHGCVYPDYIARLYGKPEEQVIEELGDLIFNDPQTGKWETADAYLSGNVRDKLAAAKRAGPEFARNVRSLEVVQPEDVLPGDIDANLGAPWIPASDIQAFAADLFKVDPSSVPVSHLKKDAVWSLVPDYAAKVSVAATSDFGTQRANGNWLLELALNMKTPTIYDTIDHGDREERVVNQDETLAAREKQKLIKERFRAWVFSDPERTERLVRIYNDTYNNLRPRLFDGSHLDFPGMNDALIRCGRIRRMPSGGHEQRQHAARPRRRSRQDVHDGRHRHEDEAGRPRQEADVRRPQPPAGAVRPRVHAALPERPAAGGQQGRPVARAPQVPDCQDRQRRLGRHHRDAFLVRADRHVATTRRRSCGADRRIRPAPDRTCCRTRLKPQCHQDHREAEGRPRGETEGPARRATRRMTASSSTSSASITSSSTRPIISRTWRRRPRWTGSPASRPADRSAPSMST